MYKCLYSALAMIIRKDDMQIFEKLDMRHPYVWIATWFGAGFLRPAPGTWGSVAAIPFALILYQYAGLYPYLLGLVVVFIIGTWASALFDKAAGGHDNKMIVVDEVVGQWLALLPVLYLLGLNLIGVLLAFVLFRLFDILKPWPISWCDKNLPGAWGVMIDDVLAGLVAAGFMWGMIQYVGFIFT